MRNNIEKLIEFLPIIVFAILYYQVGLVKATGFLVIASIISLIAIYMLKGRIPPMTLFSSMIVILFGTFTVLSGDPKFIKMKPTILYWIFATVLSYDLYAHKFWLKSVLGNINRQTYRAVAKQWVVFFIFCGFLNEFIWRNFSDQTWLLFKVFGFISLIVIFSIIQGLYFSKKTS